MSQSQISVEKSGLPGSLLSGNQQRGVTAQVKRELRRRAAIEPVIGHLKADHRMDRNHLKGRTGDAMNAILAAAGYNFSRLLAWIALLWACCQALTQIKSNFMPA
ncbi:transposase [Acidocella aminolytica 101 = DSM 11237]|nr:transposase [Acidocella aminolytica 101 = DSM 11237]